MTTVTTFDLNDDLVGFVPAADSDDGPSEPLEASEAVVPQSAETVAPAEPTAPAKQSATRIEKPKKKKFRYESKFAVSSLEMARKEQRVAGRRK